MFREVGKTKKKPFSARFPGRNKQSSGESAGNHNKIPLREHFWTQQQQRLQRNATSQTAYKSNGKTPKTSGNFLQHFSRTSSTSKIRTRSSINKGKVRGGIKTKYSSRGKNSPWEKLTKDQEILKIRKGYKIPLLRTPFQEKIPLNTLLNENNKFLVEKETKEMLDKGAIKKVSQRSYKDQWSHKYQHAQNQFLSNLFLVRKKDGCYRPVINLKTLNQFVTYIHVKIYDEGKRLHVHNRFEGRLFYSTSRQIMSSFSEVFYGKGISANACACVLVFDQPLELLSRFWKSQYPFCAF